MKANELRINNLVYCRGIIDIIEGIEDNNYYTEKHYHGVINEDLKPIQITEDILLKCGFDKISINSFWLNNTFWFTLGENALAMARPDCVDDEDYSVPIAWLKSDINYLHQLQNLYFALTENELNVTKLF